MHVTRLLSCARWLATIRLSVPGTLRYRDIAVRVVAEAARLVSGSAQRDPNDPLVDDVRDPFDTAVVSAFWRSSTTSRSTRTGAKAAG